MRGRNIFHVRDIRWSYRRRGKVARVQTNNMANRVVKEEIIMGEAG